MKKIPNQLIVLITSIFLIACNDQSESTTIAKDSTTVSNFDLDKVRTAIKEGDTKYLNGFRNKDSTEMAAVFSSDAIVMPPDVELVKGNDIATFYGGLIRNAQFKDARIDNETVTGNAELVVATGSYELYGDNNKSMLKGKYMQVWKPENGNWKVYRAIWNSDMPAGGGK